MPETIEKLPEMLSLQNNKAFYGIENELEMTLVGFPTEIQVTYNGYLNLLGNRVQLMCEEEPNLQQKLETLLQPEDRIYNLKESLEEGSLGQTLVEMCLDSWGTLSTVVNPELFPTQLQQNKDLEETFKEQTITHWINASYPMLSGR